MRFIVVAVVVVIRFGTVVIVQTFVFFFSFINSLFQYSLNYILVFRCTKLYCHFSRTVRQSFLALIFCQQVKFHENLKRLEPIVFIISFSSYECMFNARRKHHTKLNQRYQINKTNNLLQFHAFSVKHSEMRFSNKFF